MVKFKEAEKIPPEWEIIHKEIEKEFRSWAEKRGYNNLHIPRLSATIDLKKWQVQVFRVPPFLELRFRLEQPTVGPPERSILKVSIFIKMTNMKKPAMELAKILETRIPSWLPKDVYLPEIEVVLQR